jgi:hypothetical protein
MVQVARNAQLRPIGLMTVHFPIHHLWIIQGLGQRAGEAKYQIRCKYFGMKKIHPNFDLTTSSHLFSFLFMVVAVG